MGKRPQECFSLEESNIHLNMKEQLGLCILSPVVTQELQSSFAETQSIAREKHQPPPPPLLLVMIYSQC